MKKKNSYFLMLILAAIIINANIANLKDEIYKNQNEDANTIRFVNPLNYSDNEGARDICQLNSSYSDEDPSEGWMKLTLELRNAYPGYEAYCTFTLKNIGDATDRIEAITVSDKTENLNWTWTSQHTNGYLWKDFDGDNTFDPGEEVIEITITELHGLELISGETFSAQLDIKITDNAEQIQPYSFEIDILYDEAE
ncbi:unnamed protein product [marine sediment metagenome]|uniref:Uncharacterized protein n=1 Tax=marine sediment metagenome TaxID=412755 RepID=X0TUG0_9ZZZZ